MLLFKEVDYRSNSAIPGNQPPSQNIHVAVANGVRQTQTSKQGEAS
jgi:hypothetical protein